MDFEFSSEQEALREAVRRAFEDHLPIAAVRAVYDQPSGMIPAAWRALVDMGMCGVLVPEPHGGLGAGMVDAAVVLEELGRSVAPLPYSSTAITFTTFLNALGSDGDQQRLGPALADGSLVGTVAWFEPGRRYSWREPNTTATRQPDGTALVRGVKAHVADAFDATIIAFLARDRTGTVAAFTIDPRADGVTVVPEPHLDGSRKTATVLLDGAVACPLESVATPVAAARRTIDTAVVAQCVDAVGAASAALDLALAYAQERVAFGRAIGSFQAVQHLCADMLRAVELGRAAAYYACWALDAADAAEAHRAATIAAAHCAQAFPALGATAIQVFGGIGFTWEHDAHLYYKRLVNAGLTFGTAADHLEALAAIVID